MPRRARTRKCIVHPGTTTTLGAVSASWASLLLATPVLSSLPLPPPVLTLCASQCADGGAAPSKSIAARAGAGIAASALTLRRANDCARALERTTESAEDLVRSRTRELLVLFTSWPGSARSAPLELSPDIASAVAAAVWTKLSSSVSAATQTRTTSAAVRPRRSVAVVLAPAPTSRASKRSGTVDAASDGERAAAAAR